ncbi:universal stress family domain [Cordyceps militaris]|uniref:Universal stress family domain n=1 Tax=Cordyceps militaris TaxID=73501 RepID=A0A2H4SF35_CORMI|nr:universal stress family domain [Cordyceps militaris]
MWPFTGCGDDGCRPPSAAFTSLTPAHAAAASPFFLVAALATVAAVRHGYPYLSRAARDDALDGEDHVLPAHAPHALRQAHAAHGARSPRRRLVAWTFGVTVGLAAALGALILAEILDVGGRAGRGLALRLTVPALLFLLVGLVPWLECASLVRGAGWSLARAPGSRRVPRCAWLLQTALFACWLCVFWKIGRAVPSSAVEGPRKGGDDDDDGEAPLQQLMRACLERIGVVGISLMGLLAGFASVSAPWHTLTAVTDRRRRPVTEADVNRKQAGLDATNEMLLTKRHRLQALERRVADPRFAETQAATGFMGKMMGSLRGAVSPEEAEMRSLRVDIAGLETMEATLASNLALLHGRRAADARATTACGRVCLAPSYLFAAYCVYRVAATARTTLRRARAGPPSAASFASSDPINRFLGLLALHWDPTLDQTAWARIISFALSGVLLLASANSALQTLHLFARWAPGLLRHAQANLALVVGQIAATYMISASLLMRSQLPLEARSAVGGVLKGALSPVFVDGWFEGWFLTGSAVTMLGLWLGRRLSAGGRDEDWDDYGGEEMGAKRM